MSYKSEEFHQMERKKNQKKNPKSLKNAEANWLQYILARIICQRFNSFKDVQLESPKIRAAKNMRLQTTTKKLTEDVDLSEVRYSMPLNDNRKCWYFFLITKSNAPQHSDTAKKSSITVGSRPYLTFCIRINLLLGALSWLSFSDWLRYSLSTLL